MAAEQITVSRDHVYAMKGNAASVSLTVTPPDTTQDQVTLYRRKLGPNGNNGQWTNLIAVLAHPNRQSVNDLLNAGDVIEYGMFRTSANPAEGATPIVSRKVCCLRSPPEGHVTVVDNRITPGGTFAELFANTGSRTTFLRAYVRPGPATTPQAVSLPSSEFQIFDSFDQPHHFTLEPLMADTEFMCAVLAMDQVGNHSWTTYSFRTKKRHYKIDFDRIEVVDDGDTDFPDPFANPIPPHFAPNPGEMEFRIIVSKTISNGGAAPILLEAFKYGTDDNPLRLKTGDLYPLGFTREYSASNGHTGDFKVSINAHGREFDPASDEPASTGNAIEMFHPVPLDLPTGRREEVVDRAFVLNASPGGVHGATFAFKVNLKYSITYS